MKLPTFSTLATLSAAAAAVLSLSLAPSPVTAQAELPTGALRITPDELRWGPGRVPGHDIAALIGASNKPGPYVERVRFPAHTTSAAHAHPEDRSYTVIAGTWYVGFGDTLDLSKLKALPPGSFYTEPANVPHYWVTKDEAVLVQISGVGPSGTRFVDANQAPRRP